MVEGLTHASLKAKQRQLRSGFPEGIGLRIHRSLSWLGRAESCDNDIDSKFIYLWIAFNAAYAEEREPGAPSLAERQNFADFCERIVSLDQAWIIHDALWERFSGPIKSLMSNRYVFNPFWQHQNGILGFADWDVRLQKSAFAFGRYFDEGNTARVLSFVFDRLYVLRNQIMHGGATWNGNVNRQQVSDGAEIMAFLVPIFIDIMIDNPNQDWGMPFYPVVD